MVGPDLDLKEACKQMSHDANTVSFVLAFFFLPLDLTNLKLLQWTLKDGCGGCVLGIRNKTEVAWSG